MTDNNKKTVVIHGSLKHVKRIARLYGYMTVGEYLEMVERRKNISETT